MELAEWQVVALVAALAVLVVLGAIGAWARSRAARRLRAALDAYARRELAANERDKSSGHAAAVPGFKRRSYTFSQT